MKQLVTLIMAVALLQACSSSSNKKAEEKSAAKITLTAAGATFPMPYYNMVFNQYTTKTGTQLTYGGIGSGGGIRSLTDKVIDFGATDAYLEDANLSEMPAEVVHIPTVLGAVVIAYNLPGVDSLKLSNQLLEDIFMGKITKWNDPKIKQNNPGLTLP
ncbi:MAG TPA: substrate-binding domain-containing protein, partial [Draconibacterium sp.]|nr:substrate-binding domain-containing protein [Draconibacterium sp.]